MTNFFHVNLVLQAFPHSFIAVFANDSRYENVKKDLEKLNKKGEKTFMDPYFDFLMKKREEREVRRFAKLIEYLLFNGLIEEAKEAASKEEIRNAMYEKYGIEDLIETVSA